MTLTPMEIEFGGSTQLTKAVSFAMRQETRLYDVRVTAANVKAVLPPDTSLRLGGPVFHVVCHGSSTNSLSIVARDGTTVIQVLAVGEVCELWLLDRTLDHNGTWFARVRGSHTRGTALTIPRIPFTITLAYGYTTATLTDYMTAQGWDGVTAVALQVIVPYNVLRGGNPAITTGTTIPAGSTFLLRNNGFITGNGGYGGRGDTGGMTSGSDGGPGGSAVETYVNLVVINSGTIQGGGGGGGGGRSTLSPNQPGAGGGGGAGYPIGLGGMGGLPGGIQGNNGHILYGGAGITVPSGTSGAGGNPGTIGGNSTHHFGGNRGASFRTKNPATLTYVRVGTIYGPQVIF